MIHAGSPRRRLPPVVTVWVHPIFLLHAANHGFFNCPTPQTTRRSVCLFPLANGRENCSLLYAVTFTNWRRKIAAWSSLLWEAAISGVLFEMQGKVRNLCLQQNGCRHCRLQVILMFLCYHTDNEVKQSLPDFPPVFRFILIPRIILSEPLFAAHSFFCAFPQ